MRTVVIKRIEFKSFLKLILSISFITGFILGLVLLLLTPISKSKIFFPHQTLHGVIVNLILSIYFALISLVYGLLCSTVSYFAFNFYLKRIKGLTLTGEFENDAPKTGISKEIGY